ncbi:MAG TPA: hypothetical protein ENJ50_05245 [Planctomycetaceae bacterium]|nr:hypothetical protein [Planctomycetaceae bacterium]
MRIRPFRNSDPPALVQLWRRLPPLPMRAQNISVGILEEHIFAKPYFDRLGFLVAESDRGEISGFVHAAFGVDAECCHLDKTIGVVALFVPPDGGHHDLLAAELLERAEDYLRDHGARSLIAGGVSPHHPFYLGLYGGSLLPGIVVSDAWTIDRFLAAGYVRTGERPILRRQLTDFRPPVDRELIRVRRSHQVVSGEAPVAQRWCDACTLGLLHRRRFELRERGLGDIAASLDLWDMGPWAVSWGLNAMGVCRWSDCSGPHGTLCHLFLLGEAMKMLRSEGVSVLEVQPQPDQPQQMDVCRRLGFQTIDRGVVLTKDLASSERAPGSGQEENSDSKERAE